MANDINNQNQNNEPPLTGGLVVSVTTASGTRPIQGAHVIITRRNGIKEEILRTLTTNANGKTPVIQLPAPPVAYSMSSTRPVPYSNYNVRVDYPGFYTVENVDVPIFPGIVAIQPVKLIPLPEHTYRGKTKVFVEQEPSDLIEEESGGRQ